jgi:hypothetical protein
MRPSHTRFPSPGTSPVNPYEFLAPIMDTYGGASNMEYQNRAPKPLVNPPCARVYSGLNFLKLIRDRRRDARVPGLIA